ncbi:MAG: cytochrome d ubiquinol oxidase subunit II [Thermoleophilaceae bacterium]|nr:cytochrome d ubiquinol oxidase subunit II [Thermoleophilaceae bacterium]
MIEFLVLFLMLLGVTMYAVLGGADFGAGMWDLTAGSAHGGARMRGVIERSMGPVWEANHVWLIFVLVVAWTCFPTFFGSMMTSLWIPMAIAMFGIILRGAAFALRGQAATINEARTLGAIFALSSVIVPFALGTVAGGIASGQVVYGNATETDVWGAFLNPFSIYVGILAIVLSAYIAAIFLVGDSDRMGADDMVAAFRKRALGSGVLAGILAIAGLPLAHSEARYLYDGLTSGMGLVCVVVSALAGAVTLYLIWKGSTQWPRLTAAAAVGAMTAGWGFAQSPYLLPPGAADSTLKASQAIGDSTTLWWLVICVGLGLFVLVPSLYWLFKLTLTGEIQPNYRALDDLEEPDKGIKTLP